MCLEEWIQWRVQKIITHGEFNARTLTFAWDGIPIHNHNLKVWYRVIKSIHRCCQFSINEIMCTCWVNQNNLCIFLCVLQFWVLEECWYTIRHEVIGCLGLLVSNVLKLPLNWFFFLKFFKPFKLFIGSVFSDHETFSLHLWSLDC